MTTVCYRTKRGETFLSYYTYKTFEVTEKEVRTLNETHPERLWNGEKVNWSEVKEFFVSNQKEMN